MSDTPPPKLFISYSWTTPAHERWVLDLAERLRGDGVDVILDKWDLREGNDAHAFMERMVTDPEIKKVAMICDVAYVDKANRRGGGVGTETQIITGEIYAHTSQDKFVAVIAERDADGKAVVPAYYKGRIYIDLTDIERYEDEYERLVRWVSDKPLYVKPPLGKKPAFLDQVVATTLANRSAMRRVLDQLREGKATATAALGDYLSSVSARFEELRIVKSANEEFDDQVLRSIEDFIPTRDEVLAVIHAVSRYQATAENVQQIHRFFEALLHYYGPRPDVNSYTEWDFDNYKFLTQELFLHAVAIFIDSEQFEQARELVATDFYVDRRLSLGNDSILSTAVVEQHVHSLDRRNARLNLRRLSIQSDLLRERCKTGVVKFESLAQADVMLFLFHKKAGVHWWPYTALFLGNIRSPLPVFARATSTRFFNRLRAFFGIDTGEQMRTWLRQLSASNDLPRVDFGHLPLTVLANADGIATKE
ncbi:SEFIR domain-containing protein [Paraburkholderia terrae]|uniref:TIR domain-containing protein n=1 Tax=Paraburkholderia terrae TaxID=311230 RepID=UPI0030DF2251